MKKVRITVMRRAAYPDLMARYENPVEHACDLREGQVFAANGWCRPEGLCGSAWEGMSAFVMTLAHGGGNFYDGWMKKPKVRHDLPQRRLPSGALFPGSPGRGPGIR